MKELLWLWGYIKKHKVKFVLGIILVIGFAAVSTMIPYITGTIVDEVIVAGKKERLYGLLISLMLVTLARTSGAYGFSMLFESISQSTVYRARKDIYSRLNKLDFTFYDRTRTGDIMARMTGDMEAVRHFTSHVIPNLIKCTFHLVFSLSMMFMINIWFALCVIAVAPLIFIISALLAKEVKPKFAAIRKQFSKLNSVVQENIAGNRVVKAFAKENYEISKFNKQNKGFAKRNIENAKVWEKYLPLLDFICGLMVIVTVLIGGILVIQGILTIGQMAIFNALIVRVNMPLRQSGWLVNDLQNFSACADKIIGLLNEETKISNSDNAIEDVGIHGNIKFEKVSFGYGDEPVLKDINIDIKRGEKVAFIGATGSGKSTIMNLICRFYEPEEGRILLDNIDINDLALKKLRDNISVAMQDIFLFSDTIEGNISYGFPDATKKQVIRVAQMASAHDFIEEFPESYDTIIGERGVGLSGGQRQRIALARTMLKNPSVLILDDTTSSLDVETEHEIQKMLEKFCQLRTTLIIAHRISSVKNADKIFVLDNGRIVEQGTHEELVNMHGAYYEVYRNQLGDFDNASIKEECI